MQTCETCRYWREDRGRRDFSTMADDTTDKDWGICELTEVYDGNEPDDALAFASDGEGYYAVLNTHKAFGCVSHDPKDEDDAPDN